MAEKPKDDYSSEVRDAERPWTRATDPSRMGSDPAFDSPEWMAYLEEEQQRRLKNASNRGLRDAFMAGVAAMAAAPTNVASALQEGIQKKLVGGVKSAAGRLTRADPMDHLSDDAKSAARQSSDTPVTNINDVQRVADEQDLTRRAENAPFTTRMPNHPERVRADVGNRGEAEAAFPEGAIREERRYPDDVDFNEDMASRMTEPDTRATRTGTTPQGVPTYRYEWLDDGSAGTYSMENYGMSRLPDSWDAVDAMPRPPHHETAESLADKSTAAFHNTPAADLMADPKRLEEAIRLDKESVRREAPEAPRVQQGDIDEARRMAQLSDDAVLSAHAYQKARPGQVLAGADVLDAATAAAAWPVAMGLQELSQAQDPIDIVARSADQLRKPLARADISDALFNKLARDPAGVDRLYQRGAISQELYEALPTLDKGAAFDRATRGK